jgi:site-specific DNA recombinase
MSRPTPPRAALYARYSTDKQRQTSIDDQLRGCRRLCDQRGYVQVETYCDAALSGGTVARPELKRLLADAEVGRFHVIVLDSLSRLSRHPADLHLLHRHLDFAGIKIVTVDMGDISLMHVGMQGTMSGLSLEATSRETFRNQEGEVRRGGIMGGQCYGYCTVRAFDENGKVITGLREINPEEAEIILRIFIEYAAGRSAQAIAAGLNADGIPGPKGKYWQHTTILGHRKRGTGILNNELYVGAYVWNRQKFKTKPVSLEEMAEMGERRSRPRVARPNDPSEHVREEHPKLRIVPQELWDAVKARQAAQDAKIDSQQAESGGKNRRAGIGAARRSLTVLAGRLFCGCCGSKMTASGGRYVQCSTAARTGGSVCTNKKNHRRDLVEAGVFGGLDTLLGTPAMVTLFHEAYGREIAAANKARTRQHGALDDELSRIEREVGNLIAAIGRGFDNPSIKAKLDGLEARRAEIQAESAKPAPDALAPHPEAETVWQAKIRALSTNIKDGPEGQPLREALRGLFERIALAPDESNESGFLVEVTGPMAELRSPRD